MEWVKATEKVPVIDEKFQERIFSVDVIAYDGFNCFIAYYDFRDNSWVDRRFEQKRTVKYWILPPV